MKKADYFNYCTLLVAGVPGCIWRTWPGGLITGAAWGILIVALLGKAGALKAAERIDKRNNDHLNMQEGEYGD